MSTVCLATETPNQPLGASIQHDVESVIENMITSLPNPKALTAEQRRTIIARYAGVLEGNFIYWMTGAYLSVRSDQAREIILDNLLEEVRDSHPLMMRKFAIAAHAFPTDRDSLALNDDLTSVRLFIGKLSTVPMLTMMAFFEGWIQRFMSFLGDLAKEQGSSEFVYTDVHGVCDIAHTQGLFQALNAEIALNPPSSGVDLFEGVTLLRRLIEGVLAPAASCPSVN